MKAILRTVIDGEKEYTCLMFCCPGCAEADGNTGLHMLPVNTTVTSPSWMWDGNLEAPTVTPSILTHGSDNTKRCHSFLRAGVFEFGADCSHSMAEQHVPMLDLPEWVVREGDDE